MFIIYDLSTFVHFLHSLIHSYLSALSYNGKKKSHSIKWSEVPLHQNMEIIDIKCKTLKIPISRIRAKS